MSDFVKDLTDLMKRRDALAQELRAIDTDIRERTKLPSGWWLVTADKDMPMAGSVTLTGPAEDNDETVKLCVFSSTQHGKGFFIEDENGTKSPWVHPEAVAAALHIYHERLKAKGYV